MSEIDPRELGADFTANPDPAVALANTTAINAALGYGHVKMPPGKAFYSGTITVPAGRWLTGAGSFFTTLAATQNGQNGIVSVGSKLVFEGFTMEGAGTSGSSGMLLQNAYDVWLDDVAATNWGYHSFAFCSSIGIRFGALISRGSAMRGLIVDPNSGDIDGDLLDSRGCKLAGLLVGHGSHNFQLSKYRGGGERSPSIWIHNASRRVRIEQADISAPENGYQGNPSVVMGWNCTDSGIGTLCFDGWLYGAQFQGGQSDAGYASGDTTRNRIDHIVGSCYQSSASAAVLLNNLVGGAGYFARRNRIGAIDVPNAATEILDLTGQNTPTYRGSWI